MPPKPKLHKATGKTKVLPPPTLTPQASTSNEATEQNSEQARQFELELCWCIQQLQTGLKNGKLNPKQVQEHTKTLNTLMSNSAPTIKKRQLMRLSFGDYRAKMAAEDKKFSSGTPKIKVNTATPSNKSVFIKKSVFAQSTGNSFRFNFPQDTTNDIASNLSSVKIDEIVDVKTESDVNQFKFQLSDNSFKFNFTAD